MKRPPSTRAACDALDAKVREYLRWCPVGSLGVYRAMGDLGYTKSQIALALRRVATSSRRSGGTVLWKLRTRPLIDFRRNNRPPRKEARVTQLDLPVFTVAPPKRAHRRKGGDPSTIHGFRLANGLCLECGRRLVNPESRLCIVHRANEVAA